MASRIFPPNHTCNRNGFKTCSNKHQLCFDIFRISHSNLFRLEVRTRGVFRANTLLSLVWWDRVWKASLPRAILVRNTPTTCPSSIIVDNRLTSRFPRATSSFADINGFLVSSISGNQVQGYIQTITQIFRKYQR